MWTTIVVGSYVFIHTIPFITAQYFLCINRNDMQIIPPKLFNRIKMNLMGVPIPPFVASSFAEVDECYYLDF